MKNFVLFLLTFWTIGVVGCSSYRSMKPGPGDYKAAAVACLDQMYSDGVLDTLEEDELRMKVTRVLNRTSYMIQTQWITDIILSELNRNGKVHVVADGAADITLSGKIYEERERIGGVLETTYMFRLEINKDGRVIGGPWLHEIKKSCDI